VHQSPEYGSMRDSVTSGAMALKLFQQISSSNWGFSWQFLNDNGRIASQSEVAALSSIWRTTLHGFPTASNETRHLILNLIAGDRPGTLPRRAHSHDPLMPF
jgi:hypothetical protein